MSITDIKERRMAEREREHRRRGSLDEPKKDELLNRDNVILISEYDHVLFAAVVILLLFGLVMILSSSYYVSMTRFGSNIFHFFARQASATVIGFLAMIIAAVVNYHFVCKFAPVMYVVACACLAYVARYGEIINGARRWIDLGFASFQPSEFAKVSVVLMLSLYIGKDPRRANSLRGFIGCAVIVGIPVALVRWGGNTSTLIIICAIAAGMIFVASPYLWRWIALAGAAVVAFIGYL